MINKVKLELAGCTVILLNEISRKELKRLDIAMTYRLAMESSEEKDWLKINKAIIERWSHAALIYIKEAAHSGRCFDSHPKTLRRIKGRKK